MIAILMAETPRYECQRAIWPHVGGKAAKRARKQAKATRETRKDTASRKSVLKKPPKGTNPNAP